VAIAALDPPLSQGETERRDVVLKWIRSRAKQEEPEGQRCTGCLTTIPGATEEELVFAGGVYLAGGGWFCGTLCESQYRLRFRIQPARTSSGGSLRAQAGSRRPSSPDIEPVPEPSSEPPAPARRSATDELAAAIAARRRRTTTGG
jgi:hypothetical protein